MSMELLTLAFNASLNGSKKAVLIALADRANRGGYCYPSMIDIAQRAGCTKRTAITAIKKLETEGFISAVRDHGRVNKYIILIEKLSTTSETTSPVEVIHTGENPVKTGAICVKTGETLTPEPINPLTQKPRAREVAKNLPQKPNRQPHQKSKTGAEGLRGIKSILLGISTPPPNGKAPAATNTIQQPTREQTP